MAFAYDFLWALWISYFHYAADNRAALREFGALDRFVEIVGTPECNDLHVNALKALAVTLDDPESITVCPLYKCVIFCYAN